MSFSPQNAQYVKVVLNTSANVWWSIDEFNLYNPTTQPTTTTTTTRAPPTTTEPPCRSLSTTGNSVYASGHGSWSMAA